MRLCSRVLRGRRPSRESSRVPHPCARRARRAIEAGQFDPPLDPYGGYDAHMVDDVARKLDINFRRVMLGWQIVEGGLAADQRHQDQRHDKHGHN
jgi:hypothetical protein